MLVVGGLRVWRFVLVVAVGVRLIDDDGIVGTGVGWGVLVVGPNC